MRQRFDVLFQRVLGNVARVDGVVERNVGEREPMADKVGAQRQRRVQLLERCQPLARIALACALLGQVAELVDLRARNQRENRRGAFARMAAPEQKRKNSEKVRRTCVSASGEPS